MQLNTEQIEMLKTGHEISFTDKKDSHFLNLEMKNSKYWIWFNGKIIQIYRSVTATNKELTRLIEKYDLTEITITH